MGRLSLADEAHVAPTPTQWPNKVQRSSPPQAPQALHHHRAAAPTAVLIANQHHSHAAMRVKVTSSHMAAPNSAEGSTVSTHGWSVVAP